MSKLSLTIAVAGAALFVSASAFASQQGGPDTTHPIQKAGAIADWSHTEYIVQVSGGPAPTVPVDELTGGPPSDPSHVTNVGRFTGIPD
ncbi:MAG TPA: hypothetical protein VGG27_12240 [Magnetospirillaceae bacterium]|jgi:hypothetical protein